MDVNNKLFKVTYPITKESFYLYFEDVFVHHLREGGRFYDHYLYWKEKIVIFFEERLVVEPSSRHTIGYYVFQEIPLETFLTSKYVGFRGFARKRL